MATYAHLSTFMASYPEVFILRSFSELSVKNLIYLQAEIVHLESKLNKIAEQDQNLKTTFGRSCATDWETLATRAGSDSLQWQTFLQLREKLSEYHVSLLRQTKLSSLKRPDPEDLKSLRKWLERPEFGNHFLTGRPEGVWDIEKGTGDFICVADGSREIDVLTRSISRLVPYLDRMLRGKTRPANTIYHIPLSRVTAIVDGLSTVLSSLLPALSILVLYVIKSMRVRLAMILVFTALLSMTLVLFTRARRVEVFATVTAFAAIQVVFVGTTQNQPGK